MREREKGRKEGRNEGRKKEKILQMERLLVDRPLQETKHIQGLLGGPFFREGPKSNRDSWGQNGHRRCWDQQSGYCGVSFPGAAS